MILILLISNNLKLIVCLKSDLNKTVVSTHGDVWDFLMLPDASLCHCLDTSLNQDIFGRN